MNSKGLNKRKKEQKWKDNDIPHEDRDPSKRSYKTKSNNLPNIHFTEYKKNHKKLS